METLLWAIAVFLASTVDDILVVFYYHSVKDYDFWKASMLSMAIGMVQLFGFNFFIENRWYGAANVLGNGIGTAAAIWYEKNHPAKKPRDKKTGRFRPLSIVAAFLGRKKIK